MKKVLFSLVLLIIAIGALAYVRGWFSVPEDAETHKRKLVVDQEKFAKDRAAFKTTVEEQASKAKAKLAEWREALKSSPPDDKAKTEKTLAELDKQITELEEHAKDLDQAGEEKLEKLRERLDKLREHLDKHDAPKGGAKQPEGK